MIVNKLKKTKVCNNIDEVKKVLAENIDKKFCLYLAYKTDEAWEKSTSRIYMNKINDKFVYLPVNIEKEDYDSIRKVYELSEANNQILAINQTQPHKSNRVLKEKFNNDDISANIDSLVKDKNNKLQLYDLNGPSFFDWFKDEVDIFENKEVIVFGVGGAGESIARKIIMNKPKKLYLIDLVSKKDLCEELSKFGNVEYFDDIHNIEVLNNNIVFINCAGKDGANDKSTIDILNKYRNQNNIFVDLRPQLEIEVVEKAQKLGWKSYTGFGMNARNDYTLLLAIFNIMNMVPPTFEEFKQLVHKSS